MRLVVSLAAQADLERLRKFLDERNLAAAHRAGAALDDAVRSLGTFPQRGLPTSIADVRELIVPFGRSAYVLRYALLGVFGMVERRGSDAKALSSSQE